MDLPTVCSISCDGSVHTVGCDIFNKSVLTAQFSTPLNEEFRTISSSSKLAPVIVMIIIIIATILANLVICLAFCAVKILQKPKHYLLVSLAIFDLIMAIMMIPAAVYELYGTWIFGPLFCDVWIFIHQTSIGASVWNLCALSIDRYLAVQRPLRYSAKQTAARIVIYLAIILIGALSISIPPLVYGNVRTDNENRPICLIFQNVAYQIYATVAGFYIPFLVMMFTYYKIYRAVRRAGADEYQIQMSLEKLVCNVETERRKSMIPTIFQKGKKLRLKIARHYKATTILGFLVFAFAFCWLPWFVLSLIRLTIEDQARPPWHVLNILSLLFIWLGFLNSLIDPIINATMHQDFRMTIIEILCCRWSNLNGVARERIYRRAFGTPIRHFHSVATQYDEIES